MSLVSLKISVYGEEVEKENMRKSLVKKKYGPCDDEKLTYIKYGICIYKPIRKRIWW